MVQGSLKTTFLYSRLPTPGDVQASLRSRLTVPWAHPSLGSPFRRQVRASSDPDREVIKSASKHGGVSPPKRRTRKVDRWGGQDLNLRPEDYESPALTD